MTVAWNPKLAARLTGFLAAIAFMFVAPIVMLYSFNVLGVTGAALLGGAMGKYAEEANEHDPGFEVFNWICCLSATAGTGFALASPHLRQLPT